MTRIHLHSPVTDITDLPDKGQVMIRIAGKDPFAFDTVVICTGHKWPLTYEGNVPGYFDSPYPPSKLRRHLDHEIAVRGSSLTAIDAIRTLARHHGDFIQDAPHRLSFHPHQDASHFRIVLHSRHGLLPAIRFHLEDPHLSKESLLSKEDIAAHMENNEGYLSLDFIFDKDFKDSLREKDPSFYAFIKNMTIEAFVDAMMDLRENTDPFLLFKEEYSEAEQSIRREQSVYWKEMLAVLSFAMNYPAKHLSAEDMIRLQQVLMPLISIVIAFVPQSSCEELIALHNAGRLDLIAVGKESRVTIVPEGGIIYHLGSGAEGNREKPYKTYIDCTGQRHLALEAFPFPGLVRDGTVSPAFLSFRSAAAAKALQEKGHEDIVAGDNNDYYLKVPGMAITDQFRAIGTGGADNPRLYIMAVPYIGGYNPDYSGLDFCEEASKIIVADMLAENTVIAAAAV